MAAALHVDTVRSDDPPWADRPDRPRRLLWQRQSREGSRATRSLEGARLSRSGGSAGEVGGYLPYVLPVAS
jgi:hypothetical protein